jgi:hypothetical protein
MATTPVAPAPGPLELSLAQRAGAAAQTAADDTVKYGTIALNDVDKGAAAATGDVNTAAGAIEAMAARGQAALASLTQHSAAGAAGSTVQTAIEHIMSFLDMAKGFLFAHKAATGVAQGTPLTPAAASATATMAPPSNMPIAAVVPAAAATPAKPVPVSNTRAEETKHLQSAKQDITSKV